MIAPGVVDRLLRVQSADAPVLSLYFGIPPDPDEIRGAESRLNSLLKSVRELADVETLSHDGRESLRHDVDRALKLGTRVGELEDATTVRGRALRKPDYGGWHGYKEHVVHNKAETLARRHFQETAERMDDFMARASAELLVLGGRQETVAEFTPSLPYRVQAPGRVCDTCGWLGLEGDECPGDGQRTRRTSDVIDEMSALVIDTGGRVEHVYAETPLSRDLVAAFLRFPVAEPSAE